MVQMQGDDELKKMYAPERIKKLKELEEKKRKELEKTKKQVEEDIAEAEQLIQDSKKEIADEEASWRTAVRRKKDEEEEDEQDDALDEIVEKEKKGTEEEIQGAYSSDTANAYDAKEGAYGPGGGEDRYDERSGEGKNDMYNDSNNQPTSMDDVYNDSGGGGGYSRDRSGPGGGGYRQKLAGGTSDDIRGEYRGL
ncbi:MAG: hypothetical protein OXR66_05755 [Candidatus Woesearchaeota archaeon]|nr:hypothetical protein [Candidatus Woesearchaeota archaeon]